jgi:FkbM family methyltransferase
VAACPVCRGHDEISENAKPDSRAPCLARPSIQPHRDSRTRHAVIERRDLAEIITCRGIRFPGDDRILTAKVARRLRDDMYETPEVTALGRFLKPGDRVLELGAGVGFISSYIARNFAADHVACVEANPRLCAYIGRVHAMNGVTNTSIRNVVALSDAAPWPDAGTVPFHLTEPFWSSSLNAPRSGAATRIDVAAARLSDLVSELRPTVIICDIEGGEFGLFEACDLSGVRHIALELHTRVYGGAGVRKVFDDLHRHDFFYHQKVSSGDIVLFERLKTPA